MMLAARASRSCRGCYATALLLLMRTVWPVFVASITKITLTVQQSALVVTIR